MPLLQVPHLKPEAALTGCSQLCIGSHDDARGPPWFSPWKSNKKWGSPCPGRPSPPSHWNGTGPESKQDLSPSLPQARGRACLRDGFFCCSVCLLVWSGTRRYSAWSSGGVEVEGMESRGMKGAEERWVWRLLAWWGCGTRGPPLEVTSDLPRSDGVKLLHKYTQTSGSGQQRPSAASDPSADVFSFFLFFSVPPYTDDSTKCTSIPLGFFFSLSHLKASSVTGFVKKNKKL